MSDPIWPPALRDRLRFGICWRCPWGQGSGPLRPGEGPHQHPPWNGVHVQTDPPVLPGWNQGQKSSERSDEEIWRNPNEGQKASDAGLKELAQKPKKDLQSPSSQFKTPFVFLRAFLFWSIIRYVPSKVPKKTQSYFSRPFHFSDYNNAIKNGGFQGTERGNIRNAVNATPKSNSNRQGRKTGK